MSKQRRTALYKFGAVICPLICVLLVSCSPSSQQQKQASSVNSNTPNVELYSEFRPIVDQYVKQAHGWSPDMYNIEFNRWEGKVLAYWVIHNDDKKAPPQTGGDKSIEVWVDPDTRRVVGEYHFE